MNEILQSTLIPFAGTALGSACVFFTKGVFSEKIKNGLSAFAAGVMTAASVWSLIIPALEQSAGFGRFAFLPCVAGLLAGMIFFIVLDRIILHIKSCGGSRKTSMLMLAVVIHNIPEGMAAGAVYAALLSGNTEISHAAALALVTGIAIQNFPEGAIISLPLNSEGMSKYRAFLYGIISAVAEAMGAVLTLAVSELIVPFLPVMLCFAAGAMLYVVIRELVPEFSEGTFSEICIVVFALGFSVMMALDTALG
ncbi:MAG: ZIP family metal transporter [Ruminiclostridium sp.]|nr:ZIP family metal transporter [Ruminiclostridium sp.]